MQETNHQIAERLLRQRGYDKPTDVICSVREFITHCNETPTQTMGKLIQENQLVCLGESHTYEGRCLHPELIEAAAVNGANVLFIEVNATEQETIDNFLLTGDLSQLPDSCSGGRLSDLLLSDVPYLAMLEKARLLGMKIVAVDTEEVPGISHIDDVTDVRDQYIAQKIENYFAKYSNERGIFVIGQLHLLPQPFRGRFKSAFALLKETLKGGVTSIGRAYIDIKQKEQYETLLNIWALTADVIQPVIVPTKNSPFANLPDVEEQYSRFVGHDFDYLLLYPYPNDEIAKEDLERDKFLREKTYIRQILWRWRRVQICHIVK